MVWPITEDIKIPTHWPLTKDKIRFAGDAWRSSSPRRASRPRTPPRPSRSRRPSSPVVLDLEEAAKDETVIHEDLGTNEVVHWSHGGAGDQCDLRVARR